MSALVYLHIPKAAGTSHRHYLSQIYGEEALFWYGLNSIAESFRLDELGSARVIGGHKPLGFYPQSFEALFTSILRDPVERAVSYFNYCAMPAIEGTPEWKKSRTEALALWCSKGFDPSSMIRSIENCGQFRQEIQNFQCHYLSRYGATFEGVQKTLRENDAIIGLFEQLSLFNDFFQAEFQYPLENIYKANVASDGYSKAVLAEPGLVELLRSLNNEDQRIYDFVRFEHRGLYIGVENLAAVKRQVPVLKPLASPVPVDWKNVHLFSKGLVVVRPGKIRVPLILRNLTKWKLVFSQHDDGECAVGWQLRDASGKNIPGLQGIVRIDQVIPAGDNAYFVVEFAIAESGHRRVEPRSIEFSIVKNNVWIRDEFPMTSTWAVL